LIRGAIGFLVYLAGRWINVNVNEKYVYEGLVLSTGDRLTDVNELNEGLVLATGDDINDINKSVDKGKGKAIEESKDDDSYTSDSESDDDLDDDIREEIKNLLNSKQTESTRDRVKTLQKLLRGDVRREGPLPPVPDFWGHNKPKDNPEENTDKKHKLTPENPEEYQGVSDKLDEPIAKRPKISEDSSSSKEESNEETITNKEETNTVEETTIVEEKNKEYNDDDDDENEDDDGNGDTDEGDDEETNKEERATVKEERSSMSVFIDIIKSIFTGNNIPENINEDPASSIATENINERKQTPTEYVSELEACELPTYIWDDSD
jgi:hypothetical protein